MNVVLPLLIVSPLLLAGLLFLLHVRAGIRQVVLVVGLVAQLAMAVVVLSQVAGGGVLRMDVGGWGGAGIRLVADALSGLMLVLTSTVALLVAPFAIRTGRAGEPFFAPLVLVLVAGVSWTLVTADLFNLFVGVEVMLLPSYGIMMGAARGEGRLMQVTSTRIYLTLNLLTSSTILLGVAAVYAGSGQIGFAGLIGAAHQHPLTRAGVGLVLLAFAAKAAVVPAHGWLARVYPHMPATVTALFSGLQTKVAVYALFRLTSVFFDGRPDWTGVAAVVLGVTMLVGVLSALGAQEARAALSLLIVEDAGFVLMGLAVHTRWSIAAALFFLTGSVCAKLALFLGAGAVEVTYGRKRLGEVRNLLHRERLVAVGFFLTALSLVGMPMTAGFVGKLALVSAAFRAHAWAQGGVLLVTSLVTLLAVMNLWRGMFMDADDVAEVKRRPRPPRIRLSLAWPMLVAVGLVLALGVAPQPVMALAQTAADQLLHPTHLALTPAEVPR